MEYYQQGIKEVVNNLKSSFNGLKEKDAKQRLKKYGYNEIEEKNKISILKIFLSQFTDFLIIILILAAIISFAVGFFPGQPSHNVDAILILSIVFLNGIFGFIQDYKAEKSIHALKKLAAPMALVIRNGKEQEIEAKNLVSGDIVLVNQGDQIPADLRLIEGKDLEVDESVLTGESTGVAKKACFYKNGIPLADRKNILYMNTNVIRGKAKTIVVNTGMQTEVGKIAYQISKAKERLTPFQIEINKAGKKIGLIILSIIVFIAFVQFLARTLSFVEIFLTSISLAVAAIPEGLPAVVTLALAFGTRNMLKKKTLVRKLPVVEGLGSVNVVCTDKTGTLTENRMTVRKLYFDKRLIDVTGRGYDIKGGFYENEKLVSSERFDPLLLSGLLCNNTALGMDKEGKEKYLGDPTEIALWISAKKAKISEKGFKRVDEIPFSSERKIMTAVYTKDGERTAYMKGALEVVLGKCDRIYESGDVKVLTKNRKKEILKIQEKMAGRALRVLAFAHKPTKKGDDIEEKMIFLGLQGMIDPPRKEVRRAIRICKKAGIRVVMITGDHKVTAQAIAREVGIGNGTIEGKDLDKISPSDLRKKVEEASIFARVSPAHKVRILKALQSNGDIVAMTGDGINDAPALKNADVGIAMNIRGTDVARQTSDMILLDDNFATITKAIKEGRTIFDNIKKFVNYLLTSNFAEVFVVFFASLAGYLPITAVQLLWINLLTDGAPALALGVDKSAPGIMKRKPRGKKDGVLNKRLMYMIGAIGIKMTLILLIIFFIGLTKGIDVARTMVFTGIVLYEFVRIWVIRKQEKLKFFSNKWLILALGVSILLQLTVVYSPLNKFFGVVPLGIFGWGVILIGVGVGWGLAMIITRVVIRLTPSQ
ncbi:haloacid dehalogenase [archaeon]|nr:haloacid dehalogenase [archaeon]